MSPARGKLYWVHKAGRKAIDLLTIHPGRFPLMHLKDQDASGEQTDVGQGTIDLLSIVMAGIEQGTEHTFIERDNSTDPLQSAQRGADWVTRAQRKA